MKIPIHELLLYNRRDAVKQGFIKSPWKMIMYGWKKVMLNRWLLDLPGSGLKNRFLRMFFVKPWGKRRNLPQFAKKDFRQLWLEKFGENQS